ncbi:NAD(P)/FAD-dependent oxidoreductase [Pedobacter gandavensis]|uniref:NAD(P)/FAD-dependent oxidoreductase n=1 Tax=Pedobacter gandavensis TaxID=2679963 RepID=UPI0029305969|nr:NAD(P)/FAD-dependent oxidoreductase [Pedobacter gandavensis]
MIKTLNKTIDIAIIGGGVAGCTAAIALAKSYKVLLIDQRASPVPRIGECLPPASRRILNRFDLLEGLDNPQPDATQSQHLKHIGTQSYWGNEHANIVDLLRNPDGFGWHLDRQAFEIYLRKMAQQQGVHCIWPAKLQTVHFENQQWSICTSIPETSTSKNKDLIDAKYKVPDDSCVQLSAKLVIDATGRQSHFARKIGIERMQYDKLMSCYITLPNLDINKMSTISATEIGWWYSSPLPNGKRILALQTDPDLIDRNHIKHRDKFIRLAQSNREMAKLIKCSSNEIGFPQTVSANSTRLNQVAGERWLALGDAAMSFDPLSSQGMFNAMASAVQLTDLLAETDPSGLLKSESLKEIQTQYIQQSDRIWEQYLKHKKLYYRGEMRWHNAPFWKRRH